TTIGRRARVRHRNDLGNGIAAWRWLVTGFGGVSPIALRALRRWQPVLPRSWRSEDWLRPAHTRVLVHASARGWSGVARRSWPCRGRSARGHNAPALEDRLDERRTLL